MKEPTRYLVLTALFFGVLLSGLVLIRQQTGQQGALDDSFSMSNTQPKMAKLQRPYQVPIDEQKDTHFREDGKLVHQGDFTYQAAGQRIELIGQAKVGQTVKTGQVRYQLKRVQYYHNVARTTAALEQAKGMFKHASLPKDFNTLLLVYDIKNTSDRKIKTDGIAAATLPNGQVMSPIKGLYNDPDLHTMTLASGKTKQTYALLLVPDWSLQQLQPLKVDLARTYQSNGQQMGKQPFQVTLTF